ncbi:invasion associated locus B family protein [Rhizobium puerariae]|uniref:invasion associated locus B family protein n=1 Tax=Rhizobium puerariae TaxID=1585791 RepID=UPI0036724B7A
MTSLTADFRITTRRNRGITEPATLKASKDAAIMTLKACMKLPPVLLFFVLSVPGLALSQAPADGSAANVTGRIDEVRGKWIVTCLPRNGERVCAVRQIQNSKENGKPVLIVELRPSVQGTAKGGIMLPNTLRRDAGVHLALDGDAAKITLPIRDCSEKGCAVTVSFAGAAFQKLRSGKRLQVAASGQDGRLRMFAIDLDGFSDAVTRSMQLEQQ